MASRLPILYSFRRCPYAMRARMALQVAGCRYEHREVVLKNKPAALLSASPKGTVPVLITAEGLVLEQSLDIMQWALRQADPEHWLAATESQTQSLIAANDGPFKAALDRYKYPNRFPPQTTDPKHAILEFFNQLSLSLHAKPYLCGGRRQLADIAIFPFVRQCARADWAWFEANSDKALQQWLQQLCDSELFNAVMHRFAPWEADQVPVQVGPQ